MHKHLPPQHRNIKPSFYSQTLHGCKSIQSKSDILVDINIRKTHFWVEEDFKQLLQTHLKTWKYSAWFTNFFETDLTTHKRSHKSRNSFAIGDKMLHNAPLRPCLKDHFQCVCTAGFEFPWHLLDLHTRPWLAPIKQILNYEMRWARANLPPPAD